MPDFPRSLIEFQQRFPDEARAPPTWKQRGGRTVSFARPVAAFAGWALDTKAWTHE